MMTCTNVEEIRTDKDENARRYMHNAIEQALSLGDFQKEVHNECTPQTIISEAIGRIEHIINFESSAIYLVDEKTADMKLAACMPSNHGATMDAEMEVLIENDLVAWAIRERRGITLYSKDGRRQIFLHVMATYSRIRGLFMGIFPSPMPSLPDASMEIVSLILRNAINSVESIVYSGMMRKREKDLEEEVQQKTAQLVGYEKQLMQAHNAEAIAALAGGVAHQFNNALTGLIGNIELISLKNNGNSEIGTYLKRIHPIVDKMSVLTSQLLSYAQGGKHMTQVITVEKLFNEILPSIRNKLDAGTELITAINDESSKVDVDLIQIRMALLSIIKNTVEAIDKKGRVRISSQLVPWRQIPDNVSCELTPDDYICIGIEDNGNGMDDDTLRRLFEPFFSTKFTGRGLSMASVLGIIKSHNGWVTVSSKAGQGTLVQIYLPCIHP
jgi:signal transduction histidine kinase